MVDFARQRQAMVDGQVRVNDVTDQRILEAMLELPREQFVPKNRVELSYIDEDILLREAFGADTLDPAGIYFGTRGGQVYASNDEGESWRMLAEFLPPVLCVKAAVIQ